jgi:hydroxymethylpyrimidine pyrophosphatase-like HAD family hydrolase
MRSDVAGPVRPVVLADLDGTLIHSRRRVPDPTGHLVVEVYDGRDVGFITPEAWDLLAEVQRQGYLVPATARTIRQYRRIRFPEPPRVAVLAGGAIVLVDDEIDPVWDAEVRARLDAAGASVGDVAARLRDEPTTEEPRIGDDRFAYVRVAPEADVAGFTDWCTERGWRVVHQDGRIYCHPEGLSKSSPLPRVAELVGAEPAIALGDGLMDAELLAAVRVGLTPAEGPLWMSGWRQGSSVDGFGPASTTLLLAAVLDSIAISNPPTPDLPPAGPTKESN